MTKDMTPIFIEKMMSKRSELVEVGCYLSLGLNLNMNERKRAMELPKKILHISVNFKRNLKQENVRGRSRRNGRWFF